MYQAVYKFSIGVKQKIKKAMQINFLLKKNFFFNSIAIEGVSIVFLLSFFEVCIKKKKKRRKRNYKK